MLNYAASVKVKYDESRGAGKFYAVVSVSGFASGYEDRRPVSIKSLEVVLGGLNLRKAKAKVLRRLDSFGIGKNYGDSVSIAVKGLGE